MGNSGCSTWRGLTGFLIAAMMLSGPLLIASPSQGAAGDLMAPVYIDGDWWNYTVAGPYRVSTMAGQYEVDLDEAQGWLRYEVDGTSSHLGELAWVMKVTGRLNLAGEWSSATESGSTSMPAKVQGQEWRSVDDLAFLGSILTYTGRVEIATMSGPEFFNLTIEERRNPDLPLRMMLFPVPVAQFPKEEHTVTITEQFTTGTFVDARVETWEYVSTYRGLSTVQGSSITYNNQHKFQIKGNVTVGGTKTPVDSSLFYEASPRKAVTVDQLDDIEVLTYHLSQTIPNPDLVVADSEFVPSSYAPLEGTEVNLSATVHNLGSREVIDVLVELWASIDEALPSLENSTRIKSIPANEGKDIHFNWTPEEIGEWMLFVRVDPSNTVTEAREDNNEAAIAISVSPFAPRPNLLVPKDGMTLTPKSPVNNRTAVEVNVAVSNVGMGPAENVTIDLYLGRPDAGGRHIASRMFIDIIPVGQKKTAWVQWAADTPGSHEIWAYVDQDNKVEETVETDNLGSIPIIIIASPPGGVNLALVRIKVLDADGKETSPIPHGTRTTVQALISNDGPNDAARVHLSLYVDEEAPGTLIGSHEGPIKKGEPVTWEATWVVDVEDGNHSILATVLALGDVDSDLRDNERSLGIKIGPRVIPEPEPLDVTVYATTNVLTLGQSVQVSGKVTIAKNGFEVPGASVMVWFKGIDQPVTVTTNEKGRYLATIFAPNKAGTYRLEVSAFLDYGEGSNFESITVKDAISDGGGTSTESGTVDWLFFAIAVVIVLAIGMPLTYYMLLSKAAFKRRIRRVHEEIVEIVEEDK